MKKIVVPIILDVPDHHEATAAMLGRMLAVAQDDARCVVREHDADRAYAQLVNESTFTVGIPSQASSATIDTPEFRNLIEAQVAGVRQDALPTPSWHAWLPTKHEGWQDGGQLPRRQPQSTTDKKTCIACGGPNTDGEGYNGLCSTCADRSDNDDKVAEWVLTAHGEDFHAASDDGTENWRIMYARHLAELDPQEHEYAFDCVLSCAVRVKGRDETAARATLKEQLDASDANLGQWPNGDPILAEVSLILGGPIDVPPRLYEIDGEQVE
jgi:hypothetical protein